MAFGLILRLVFSPWFKRVTDKEALKEARRRWGRRAVIIHFTQRLPPWAQPYSVGLRKKLLENEVLGAGMSWEEAFKDADQRYAKKELSDEAVSRLSGNRGTP